MSHKRLARCTKPGAAEAMVRRLRVEIGIAVRSERRARAVSLRELAEAAGVDPTTVHNVEVAEPASLEVLQRVSTALGLELRVEIAPARRGGVVRVEDPVHAAMGEIEAAHFGSAAFAAMGVHTNLDVPFQHYQHAGRADFLAWTEAPARLLHVENRTQFPNIQAALGSFNAKRAYLGAELGSRLGVGRWQAEAHVIVALWSAETLHSLRLRAATWRAACPDAGSFEAWWRGDLSNLAGVRSEIVVWDPLAGGHRDRRRWAGLDDLATIRPRYRDYRDGLEALRSAQRA
jgi:transcriptional regulator with XRE-family HTH domain